jgi:16S rRNA (adenine1518-N6/adenine1519-N6)-dimethyltransferase
VGPAGGRGVRSGPLSQVDPADRKQLDRLLRQARVRPKKSFGQNFLVDPGLRDQVVAAAGIQAGDEVLEVGAGAGTLTVRLAGLSRRLVAVELDRGLARILRQMVPGAEVVEQDILTVDLAGMFPAGGEVVVGNIPYYLTGALMRKLLDEPPRPRRISLVVQREVADRWLGNGGWSLATVSVQAFTEPRIALELPAEAFEPRPRVGSALVVMEVRDRPAVGVPDMNGFLRFAEAVFQFRRKQLQGSLARVAGVPGAEAATRLAAAGIDPKRRPETLNLEEWTSVYAAFAS